MRERNRDIESVRYTAYLKSNVFSWLFSFLGKLSGTDNRLRDTHAHTLPDNTVRPRRFPVSPDV